MYPLIGSLGTPELLLILAVLVLLFGASKLPDLARGSGRALRIFKAETKGLTDEGSLTPEEREIRARNEAAAEADAQRVRDQQRHDDPSA